MIRGILLIGFCLLMMGGCMQAPEDAKLVEHMVVQTNYDTARIKESSNIFNTYNTFFIRADTMGYVLNSPGADTILIDPIKGGTYYFVTPVVDEIRDQVQLAGYTSVDEDQNPDFAIKVAVLENFSYYQTISNGYYGGYYGYYGYYYPVVATYYSNSATLLIEIVDVKNYAINGNKYVVVWRAYIGDLIKTIDLTGKTREAVVRAFEQSPYISK